MSIRKITSTGPYGDILALNGTSGAELEVERTPDRDGEIRVNLDSESCAYLGREERAALVEWLIAIDAPDEHQAAIEAADETVPPRARAERRQRARKAFWDNIFVPATKIYETIGATQAPVALDAAIETATRVHITDEAIEAFGQAWRAADPSPTRESGDRRRAGLRAALGALGFEVEP